MNVRIGEFSKLSMRLSAGPPPNRCTALFLSAGAPLIGETLCAIPVTGLTTTTNPPPTHHTHAAWASSQIPQHLFRSRGSLLAAVSAWCLGSLRKRSGPSKANNKKWAFHLVSCRKNNTEGEKGEKGEGRIRVWVDVNTLSSSLSANKHARYPRCAKLWARFW